MDKQGTTSSKGLTQSGLENAHLSFIGFVGIFLGILGIIIGNVIPNGIVHTTGILVGFCGVAFLIVAIWRFSKEDSKES